MGWRRTGGRGPGLSLLVLMVSRVTVHGLELPPMDTHGRSLRTDRYDDDTTMVTDDCYDFFDEIYPRYKGEACSTIGSKGMCSTEFCNTCQWAGMCNKFCGFCDNDFTYSAVKTSVKKGTWALDNIVPVTFLAVVLGGASLTAALLVAFVKLLSFLVVGLCRTIRRFNISRNVRMVTQKEMTILARLDDRPRWQVMLLTAVPSLMFFERSRQILGGSLPHESQHSKIADTEPAKLSVDAESSPKELESGSGHEEIPDDCCVMGKALCCIGKDDTSPLVKSFRFRWIGLLLLIAVDLFWSFCRLMFDVTLAFKSLELAGWSLGSNDIETTLGILRDHVPQPEVFKVNNVTQHPHDGLTTSLQWVFDYSVSIPIRLHVSAQGVMCPGSQAPYFLVGNFLLVAALAVLIRANFSIPFLHSKIGGRDGWWPANSVLSRIGELSYISFVQWVATLFQYTPFDVSESLVFWCSKESSGKDDQLADDETKLAYYTLPFLILLLVHAAAPTEGWRKWMEPAERSMLPRAVIHYVLTGTPLGFIGEAFCIGVLAPFTRLGRRIAHLLAEQFGIWTSESIFQVMHYKETYPELPDSAYQDLMANFGALHSSVWCLAPGGFLASKLSETLNAAPVAVFPEVLKDDAGREFHLSVQPRKQACELIVASTKFVLFLMILSHSIFVVPCSVLFLLVVLMWNVDTHIRGTVEEKHLVNLVRAIQAYPYHRKLYNLAMNWKEHLVAAAVCLWETSAYCAVETVRFIKETAVTIWKILCDCAAAVRDFSVTQATRFKNFVLHHYGVLKKNVIDPVTAVVTTWWNVIYAFYDRNRDTIKNHLIWVLALAFVSSVIWQSCDVPKMLSLTLRSLSATWVHTSSWTQTHTIVIGSGALVVIAVAVAWWARRRRQKHVGDKDSSGDEEQKLPLVSKLQTGKGSNYGTQPPPSSGSTSYGSQSQATDVYATFTTLVPLTSNVATPPIPPRTEAERADTEATEMEFSFSKFRDGPAVMSSGPTEAERADTEATEMEFSFSKFRDSSAAVSPPTVSASTNMGKAKSVQAPVTSAASTVSASVIPSTPALATSKPRPTLTRPPPAKLVPQAAGSSRGQPRSSNNLASLKEQLRSKDETIRDLRRQIRVRRGEPEPKNSSGVEETHEFMNTPVLLKQQLRRKDETIRDLESTLRDL